MSEATYVLYAAMYGLDAEAAIEFPIVVSWQDKGSELAGATIVRRRRDGVVRLEQPGSGTLAYTTGIGVAVGFALNYWIAVPMIPAVVGGAIGYLYGRSRRERQARTLGRELTGFLPLGASAIVAVVAEPLIGQLNRRLGLALRTTVLSLDEPELLQLAQALVRGHTELEEALAERADAQAARERDFPELP